MQNNKSKNSPEVIPFLLDKLLNQLRHDFPNLKFNPGKKFTFRPPKTIIYDSSESQGELLLLHELGHALSKHQSYKTDVERIKMEVEAWEKARELATIYKIEYDEELAQTELDTYRDWLHKKSSCPNCGLTRFQTPDAKYHCPRCENLS